MHITLETDYAVRIVGCLAESGERLDAKKISEITCVTQRFSLKILRKLVASRIVKSYKGANGGYEIAKEPKDITLREVIETVEGPYVFNRCLNTGFDCSRGMIGVCNFQRAFSDISKVVAEKLDTYTFDKLICCEKE